MQGWLLGVSIVASLGWRAPPSCPGEPQFRQLVTVLLGGASPDDYETGVDARVRSHGVDGFELAIRSLPHIPGLTADLTSVGRDCAALMEVAAAWAATQLDPLGLGPDVPDVVDATAIVVPATPEHGSSEPTRDEPAQPGPAQPEPAAPADPGEQAPGLESSPSRGRPAGLMGVAAGAALGFTSPVVTTASLRGGLRWRTLQVAGAAHVFIDTGLTSAIDQRHVLTVWSVGPELCWAPSLARMQLSACALLDGGRFHLSSSVDGPSGTSWLRAGVSASVGVRVGGVAEPFFAVGFSHMLADVEPYLNGPELGPIGSFVTLNIGSNFMLRRKQRASP